MNGGEIRLVKVTGKCPHCGVRKHQIDGTEERAVMVLNEAFTRHIAEAHHLPDCGDAGCEDGCPQADADEALLIDQRATDEAAGVYWRVPAPVAGEA